MDKVRQLQSALLNKEYRRRFWKLISIEELVVVIYMKSSVNQKILYHKDGFV